MTEGPLSPDEVVVTSFSGREAISRLFAFAIEFISSRCVLRIGSSGARSRERFVYSNRSFLRNGGRRCCHWSVASAGDA